MELATEIRRAAMGVRPRPVSEHLLGPRFSIRELREVHEAITGKSLQKDTFRRAMESRLQGTGALSTGTIGRPSQRFRRAR